MIPSFLVRRPLTQAYDRANKSDKYVKRASHFAVPLNFAHPYYVIEFATCQVNQRDITLIIISRSDRNIVSCGSAIVPARTFSVKR